MLASIVFVISVTVLYWLNKRKDGDIEAKLDTTNALLKSFVDRMDRLMEDKKGGNGKG